MRRSNLSDSIDPDTKGSRDSSRDSCSHSWSFCLPFFFSSTSAAKPVVRNSIQFLLSSMQSGFVRIPRPPHMQSDSIWVKKHTRAVVDRGPSPSMWIILCKVEAVFQLFRNIFRAWLTRFFFHLFVEFFLPNIRLTRIIRFTSRGQIYSTEFMKQRCVCLRTSTYLWHSRGWLWVIAQPDTVSILTTRTHVSPRPVLSPSCWQCYAVALITPS